MRWGADNFSRQFLAEGVEADVVYLSVSLFKLSQTQFWILHEWWKWELLACCLVSDAETKTLPTWRLAWSHTLTPEVRTEVTVLTDLRRSRTAPSAFSLCLAVRCQHHHLFFFSLLLAAAAAAVAATVNSCASKASVGVCVLAFASAASPQRLCCTAHRTACTASRTLKVHATPHRTTVSHAVSAPCRRGLVCTGGGGWKGFENSVEGRSRTESDVETANTHSHTHRHTASVPRGQAPARGRTVSESLPARAVTWPKPREGKTDGGGTRGSLLSNLKGKGHWSRRCCECQPNASKTFIPPCKRSLKTKTKRPSGWWRWQEEEY